MVSVQYPRGLGQYQLAQFLVFGQFAGEAGLRALLPLPQFQHGFYMGCGAQYMVGQTVSVVGGNQADGVVLIGLADAGQCLYHHPCRVLGIFHGVFHLLGFYVFGH